MKKSEFVAEYNYTDQAPRCYLCEHYRVVAFNEKRPTCHIIPGAGIKVKPNGICKAYKAGVYAIHQPKPKGGE